MRTRTSTKAAPSTVTYRGVRDPRPGEIAIVTRNGSTLRNARPGEIEWGHEGQGPLMLARALVRDAVGRDAVALSHAFMVAVLAKLPRAGWTMTSDDVQAWIASERAVASAAPAERKGAA